MKYIDNNDYELIYLIKEDNEQALNIMFNKYQPLIKKIAHYYFERFKGLKIEFEDLVQEGMIGLCEAIRGFKLDKEVLFFTFAFLCIKRKIASYIRKIMTDANLSLYASLSIDSRNIDKGINYEEPLTLMEEKVFIEHLINFKNTLDFIDANIFELRYNSFSYKEISKFLGINKKAIDNRLMKIRNKLKNYLLQLD